MRMLGQREDAEDCAQETFVRCYQGLRDFRGDARFSTWLYRIAFNTCLNRKASAAHRHRSEEVSGDWVEQIPRSDGETPETWAARKRQTQQIHAALTQVPEEFRQALILRDIEGRDYGEVAEVLKIPVGTVRSRLNRGRQKLREILEGVK
jgi:RNA polymerase sigma-70 factor (ECF subfamily)